MSLQEIADVAGMSLFHFARGVQTGDRAAAAPLRDGAAPVRGAGPAAQYEIADRRGCQGSRIHAQPRL